MHRLFSFTVGQQRHIGSNRDGHACRGPWYKCSSSMPFVLLLHVCMSAFAVCFKISCVLESCSQSVQKQFLLHPVDADLTLFYFFPARWAVNFSNSIVLSPIPWLFRNLILSFFAFGAFSIASLLSPFVTTSSRNTFSVLKIWT